MRSSSLGQELLAMANEIPREIMESCLAAAQEATFTGFDDSVLKEVFAGPHRRLFETIYRMAFESGWRIHEKQITHGVTGTSPPFERDSWQHAVDDQLSALGKTSQEFATPHDAVRWLLQVTGDAALACHGISTHGVATALPERGNTTCNPHPDAPHGFNRNASHNAGRYVCDCEGWMPPHGVTFLAPDQSKENRDA